MSCNHSQPAPSADRAAELMRLRFLARKVAMVHGPHRPQLGDLAELVERLAQTPETAIADRDAAEATVLTDDFKPWNGACGSVQALYSGLRVLCTVPVKDASAAPSGG